MSALSALVAACDALASDKRYAQKTRTLASTLKAWATTQTEATVQIAPRKQLSAADLLGLSETNTVELVAAPGPGKMLFPEFAITVYRAATTPYDDPGYRLFIGTIADWNNGAYFPLQNDNLGVGLDQTTDQLSRVKLQRSVVQGFDVLGPMAGLENQPLVVAVQEGHPLTGGDGTLDITLVYSVIDV